MIKNVSEKVFKKEITSIVKEEAIIEEKEVVKEEIRIPDSLKDGKVRIGIVETENGEKEIYYPVKEHIDMTPRIVIGSMGSGKSYYMMNMIKDAVKLGRPIFVIDMIRGSQLSEAIKSVAGEDRIVEIDVTNEKQMQSFNFNEFKIRDDMGSDTKLLDIMRKAGMIVELIDSIGNDNERLSVRMMRYIDAIAVLVFYNNYDATLKDVCEVLMDADKQIELINTLSDEGKELLSEELSVLEKLNYFSASDIRSNIELDTISQKIYLLRSNIYTKLAYKSSCTGDIDFTKAINENKIVLIKIPEDKFNSVELVDFIANFYLCKIGLAKSICRDVKSELYFDEIGRFTKCQRTMLDLCLEHRTMRLMPVISMSNLKEYDSRYRKGLLFVGASIIVLSKYDNETLEQFYPYLNNGCTKEDLKNIKRYNAMAIIKTNRGYMSYLVKLPK